MAKFSGMVGFAEQIETKPGIWKDKIIERKYYGDLIRFNRRWQASGEVNDNLKIDNQISIVSDPYARLNFGQIKYVSFGGVNWKVSAIEFNYPRLLLTIGDVYNGQTP